MTTHDDTSRHVRKLFEQGKKLSDIAEILGLEIDDDTLIDAGWRGDDGNAEVAFPYADSAQEAANEYVADGAWGDGNGLSTVAVDVIVWRPAWRIVDGELVAVRLDEQKLLGKQAPDEPPCDGARDGEHDFQGAVHGLRGGASVHVTTVCMLCGCRRESWSACNVVETQHDFDGVRYTPRHDFDAVLEYHRVNGIPDNLDPESALGQALAADDDH